MESGIPVLTAKGSDALKSTPPEMTPLCRNILVQVDGKKSLADIQSMFRGLKGLDEAVRKLLSGNFIKVSRECSDLIKGLAEQMLGSKSITLVKKIDEIHARYGEQCWDHLDEVEKLARMFYGEVIASELQTGITKILRETRK